MASATKASAQHLLDWYDQHGRDLPWRVKGEGAVDPYRVWLSEIMLQQTTVEAVKPYFARFLALWPDVRALAAADDAALMAAWAGLGYYARARNLLACARMIVAEHDGQFPSDEVELRALPGIGAYTAAAIAAIAFGRPALVIDGNVERVITRLAAIATPLPQAKGDIRSALATIAPEYRAGDFAQAMMDLGATICTPRKPDCAACPWSSSCRARRTGTVLNYPVKAARKAKRVRHGLAFLVRDEHGRLLLRTRPAKGLLAGMAEIPSGPWSEALSELQPAPPLQADFRLLAQPVVHVFTHFELRMQLAIAQVGAGLPPPQGCRWVDPGRLEDEPLPTLMRKLIAAGLAALQAA